MLLLLLLGRECWTGTDQEEDGERFRVGIWTSGKSSRSMRAVDVEFDQSTQSSIGCLGRRAGSEAVAAAVDEVWLWKSGRANRKGQGSLAGNEESCDSATGAVLRKVKSRAAPARRHHYLLATLCEVTHYTIRNGELFSCNHYL